LFRAQKIQQARGFPGASLSRGPQVDEIGAGRVAGFQALQGFGDAAQDDSQFVIQFVGCGGSHDPGTVCFHGIRPLCRSNWSELLQGSKKARGDLGD